MTAKDQANVRKTGARSLPRLGDLLERKREDPAFARLLQEDLAALRLGLALCEAREALGLTQREMEERTGIPQETLSRIERGRLPSLTTLSKIAQALQVQVILRPDGTVTIEPVMPLPQAA